MPARRLVIPVAVSLFVVVQVALLRQLLGAAGRQRQQAPSREQRLEAQLQALQGSLEEARALHSRVQRKLGDFGRGAGKAEHPDATAIRDAAPAALPQGAAQAVSGEGGEEVRHKISLADLADAVRRQADQANAGDAGDTGGTADPEAGPFPSAAPDGRQLLFPPGHEEGGCVGGRQAAADAAVAAVVTVTFDRPDYLRRHLDSLLAVHGRDAANQRAFPLFISQDGREPQRAVAALARAAARRGVAYLHHREQAPPVRLLDRRENLAYYRIAAHYRFILRTFFDCFGFARLIILEDDMQLAPDFFSLFNATAPLLSADASLLCVSSWNDHGQQQFVADEGALLRSDFFPGLGWMLTAQLWAELRDAWPKAYWDDWMRLDRVRRGRQCLRPEVCRTYNFGAKGASRGTYFKRFLAPVRLASQPRDWAAADLSYLQQPRYDAELNATLEAARLVASVEEAQAAAGDVVLRYESQEHYEQLTGQLGMLREWKDGVPRGGYRGIVTVRLGGARLFLAPAPGFHAAAAAAEGNGTRVRVDATGALLRGRQEVLTATRAFELPY